jgi:hypothetical protein
MVISYNQNLYLKQQSKNPETKLHFISLFFDTTKNSHNNMNMKIIVEICCLLKTSIKIQQKIPCSIEKWNQTSRLNLWYIKNSL